MKISSIYSASVSLVLLAAVDGTSARSSSRPFGLGSNMATLKTQNKIVSSSSSTTPEAVLALRGGGGLNAEVVAKWSIGAMTVQSMMGALSPTTSAKVYEWDSKDPVLRYLMYFMSGAMLVTALTLGLQVFYGMSRMQATGYASISYIVIMLQVLLNKMNETVRTSKLA